MSKTKDYQALQLELDEVLSALQRPTVRVDEAVALYEKGLQVIAAIETQLTEAENTIERLKLAAAKADQ